MRGDGAADGGPNGGRVGGRAAKDGAPAAMEAKCWGSAEYCDTDATDGICADCPHSYASFWYPCKYECYGSSFSTLSLVSNLQSLFPVQPQSFGPNNP